MCDSVFAVRSALDGSVHYRCAKCGRDYDSKAEASNGICRTPYANAPKGAVSPLGEVPPEIATEEIVTPTTNEPSPIPAPATSAPAVLESLTPERREFLVRRIAQLRREYETAKRMNSNKSEEEIIDNAIKLLEAELVGSDGAKRGLSDPQATVEPPRPPAQKAARCAFCGRKERFDVKLWKCEKCGQQFCVNHMALQDHRCEFLPPVTESSYRPAPEYIRQPAATSNVYGADVCHSCGRHATSVSQYLKCDSCFEPFCGQHIQKSNHNCVPRYTGESRGAGGYSTSKPKSSTATHQPIMTYAAKLRIKKATKALTALLIIFFVGAFIFYPTFYSQWFPSSVSVPIIQDRNQITPVLGSVAGWISTEINGPPINNAWAEQFMVIINQDRNQIGLSTLVETTYLDGFAQQRFQTMIQEPDITHYGYQNIPPGIGEVVYYPAGNSPANFASSLEKNDPLHWQNMMTPQYTSDGFYVGTGPTYLVNSGCPDTELPGPGINITQFFQNEGCTATLGTSTWLVIDFSV
jgi:uncharacterized protein YkwD/predicted nucleic acid binding AN1-type Zn finger protein